MKINVNGNALSEKAIEKEKELIKGNCGDVVLDNLVAPSPTKCVSEKEAAANNDDKNSSTTNQTNNQSNQESYIQMLQYKQRMDRGLFFALSLIIVLCILGMGTSIGGAIYLKFRSNRSTAQPYHQHLVSVDAMNSSSSQAATQIHIRVNITLPDIDDTQTQNSATMDKSPTPDPYEDVIWDEIRRRHGLGGGMAGGSDDTDLDKTASDNHISIMSTSTETTVQTDKTLLPNYTSVNKHRILQEPPSLADFLTFIRRALRIPTIKIVRDHE